MVDRKTFKIDPSTTVRHENVDYSFKQLVDFFLHQHQKVDHKVYRKIVKKVQRKHYRQVEATKETEKETETDNEYEKKKEKEEKEEEKRARIEQSQRERYVWIEREKLAQLEWAARKRQHEENETRAAKQREARLRADKINANLKLKQQQQQQQQEREQEIKKNENDANKSESQNLEEELCKYFVRTGVCKYGVMCNKSHQFQSSSSFYASSTSLIIPGMYKNMLLGYETLHSTENDCDESLEYEECDVLDHFAAFHDDLHSELTKYGELVQLLVCSNYEPHLRGNVYVQYEKACEARNAYEHLNGRYYAGRAIFCYFTHLTNWRDALCREFLLKKSSDGLSASSSSSSSTCLRGKNCQYLHVFRHPRINDSLTTCATSKLELQRRRQIRNNKEESGGYNSNQTRKRKNDWGWTDKEEGETTEEET